MDWNDEPTEKEREAIKKPRKVLDANQKPTLPLEPIANVPPRPVSLGATEFNHTMRQSLKQAVETASEKVREFGCQIELMRAAGIIELENQTSLT